MLLKTREVIETNWRIKHTWKCAAWVKGSGLKRLWIDRCAIKLLNHTQTHPHLKTRMMQTNIIIFGTLSSGLGAIHNSGGHFYSLKYFWQSKHEVHPVTSWLRKEKKHWKSASAWLLFSLIKRFTSSYYVSLIIWSWVKHVGYQNLWTWLTVRPPVSLSIFADVVRPLLSSAGTAWAHQAKEVYNSWWKLQVCFGAGMELNAAGLWPSRN